MITHCKVFGIAEIESLVKLQNFKMSTEVFKHLYLLVSAYSEVFGIAALHSNL